jgi:hypothetical protein
VRPVPGAAFAGMFRRSPVELPIDAEGVGIIMWLLADIRAELVGIHMLLKDENDGGETDQNS